MGICINYSGSFKKTASLKSFIEEVKDVAIANNWRHQIFKDTFDPDQLGETNFDLNEIYGINITPPNCETVTFTFLSNGKMANQSSLESYIRNMETNEYKNPERFLYFNFSKTQYAGYQVHKKLCDFFKYLAPKYFNDDFIFEDDTNYYEDNDDAKLIKQFDRSSAIISMFSSAFDVVKPQKGESIKDFLQKVGNIVSNNLKDKFDGNELTFEILQINLNDDEDKDSIDDILFDDDLTKLD